MMRSYPTLTKLWEEGQVEFEGVLFKKVDGPLQVGDTYIAERHTGPKLLTVKRVDLDYYCVVPVEFAYCFDINECVKVELVD